MTLDLLCKPQLCFTQLREIYYGLIHFPLFDDIDICDSDGCLSVKRASVIEHLFHIY